VKAHTLVKPNTHSERLWFSSSGTDINFGTGVQWVDGQKQATANTAQPQHSSQLSTRNPVVRFFEVGKTRADIFRILENSLQSVCSATARTKIALGILQLRCNYSAECLFKALGIYFSWKTKKRNASVVVALLSALHMGLMNPVCQSFGALAQCHATRHTVRYPPLLMA